MVLSKGEEELLLGGGEINRMVSSSKNGAVARWREALPCYIRDRRCMEGGGHRGAAQRVQGTGHGDYVSQACLREAQNAAVVVPMFLVFGTE